MRVLSKCTLLATATLLLLGSTTPVGAAPKEEPLAEVQEKIPDARLKHSETLDDGSTVKVYEVSAEALTVLRGSGEGKSNAPADVVSEHVDLAMRQGSLVDQAAVDSIAIDIPDTAAVYAVQSQNDELGDLLLLVEESPDHGEVAISVGYVVGNNESASNDGEGPGFNGATNPVNMTRIGGDSRTLFFSPNYNSSVDHWVTTNWEKWQSNVDSRDWLYNRWATFDAANGGSAGLGMTWRGEIIDATIRSKPWSGKEDRVSSGPHSYAPSPQANCSTYEGSLSTGVASIKIPLVTCGSQVEIYPNGNQHSMGVGWYSRTTSQVYLDFAFTLRTAESWYEPSYADYVWMTVQYCKGYTSLPCGGWNPKEHETWSDNGW